MSLYSSHDSDVGDGWLVSINTTPLVGVMLALLVIFLIALPIYSASVKVSLPLAPTPWRDPGAEPVFVSVDRTGRLYFNDDLAPDIQALSSMMETIARRIPQPALHIRADANAPYAYVGQVIDTAQGHGFSRVSLITDPADK